MIMGPDFRRSAVQGSPYSPRFYASHCADYLYIYGPYGTTVMTYCGVWFAADGSDDYEREEQATLLSGLSLLQAPYCLCGLQCLVLSM